GQFLRRQAGDLRGAGRSDEGPREILVRDCRTARRRQALREKRTMSGDCLKVLLVDDDEDDYILTRSLFDEISHGRHDLAWVSTYEQARRTLANHKYDVCLLDYHLGLRTGLDLLRELIADGCQTPIILLTGLDDRDVDLEAMKAGAADYLV